MVQVWFIFKTSYNSSCVVIEKADCCFFLVSQLEINVILELFNKKKKYMQD